MATHQTIRLLFDAQPANVGGASWIQLLPAGPNVAANDGRSFLLSDLSKVAAATRKPLLLDWEHQSETGGSTEAAGWIEELAVDPTGSRFGAPGMFGRVRWTPEGQVDVQARAYRYVSPAVVLDSDSQGLYLSSVALTNRPALDMKAIQTFSRKDHAARLRDPAGENDKISQDKNGRTPRVDRYTAEREERLRVLKDPATADYLARNGATPEEVARTLAYVAQQDRGPALSEAEQDAELARQGFTREQIAAARACMAGQR